jgi:hypothetical protein
LAELVFSAAINPRDFIVIAIGIAARRSRMPTPVIIGVGIFIDGESLFGAMMDRSRAGLIDLCSLPVP